jgi:fatty acid amide hydrolase
MYGIPISLKDTIYLKGMSSTAGTTIRHRIIESEDGLYASVLRKGGLIPFVKSNLAQLVMTYESTNHLFGRARNPGNQKRTTGGSSGGEGGLIASRCSVVGIGSDVGGSIRIPS